MVLLALLVALAGVGLRFALASSSDLGPDDLQRFEGNSGIDLPDFYADQPFFLLWTRGDGQTFVTLAADLNLDGPAQRLLLPSYRYTRVGYAWLGRLAALGRVDWVPIGLMLVNLVALGGVGVLTGRLVERWGERAYLILLNPGMYVGFASDTAEPVGLLLLLMALVTGSAMLAGLMSAALGTVRPSLGVGLPARNRNVALVVGMVAAGAGLIRLLARLGIDDTTTPIETLVWPLTGYFKVFRGEDPAVAIGAAALLVAVLFTAVVGGLRRRRGQRVAWLACAALLLCLGSFVLNNPFNWSRAAAVLPVLWSLPADPPHPRPDQAAGAPPTAR